MVVSENTVTVGTPVTFVVSATDNVGVESIALNIDGIPVPLDAAGRATITKDVFGDFEVIAIASDAVGNTGFATTTLLVRVQRSAPLQVITTSPVDAQEVAVPISDGLSQYTFNDSDRLLTETLAGDETCYTYDDNGNTLSKTSATDSVLCDWRSHLFR